MLEVSAAATLCIWPLDRFTTDQTPKKTSSDRLAGRWCSAAVHNIVVEFLWLARTNLLFWFCFSGDFASKCRRRRRLFLPLPLQTNYFFSNFPLPSTPNNKGRLHAAGSRQGVEREIILLFLLLPLLSIYFPSFFVSSMSSASREVR